jgi:hypothetical protein
VCPATRPADYLPEGRALTEAIAAVDEFIARVLTVLPPDEL